MKLTYRYILAAVAISASASSFAQNLHSAYFTSDFKYRHDMNPAFGNEQNYFSLPGFGNVNATMMGNFGLEDVLFDNPSPTGKKKTTFMNPKISVSEALSGFHENNKVNGEFKVTILSGGFKGFGGYNTLEVSLRGGLGASLPYELFDFAKNTGNKSYDIGDINAEFKSFAEVALGHSHQINEKLRVGAKVKVLLGVGRGSFDFKNVTANLTGNEWQISGDALTSVSAKGFQYKSESKDYKSKSGQYQRVNGGKIDGAGIGGFGLGLDLGASYQMNEDVSVSAAVLDLGFINWNNDVQATNSAKSFSFSGFHDTSVTSDGNNTIDDQSDSYSDQISNFTNLQDQGDKGSKSTAIGATVNVGCEYVFPYYRNLTFGFLGSSRFNGDYSWTEGRLSANVAPLRWIDGGVNLAVGTYGTSFGWILNVHPKGVNLFVGMDRLIARTSKEYIPVNSKGSVSMGVNFTW